MSFNILNINEPVYLDNSISNMEYHTYIPYSSNSLSHNDEIRISIQGQDLYTLPSKSFILIDGKLTDNKDAVSATLKFTNNGILSLFDEIRYELGGSVIDKNRNPMITSTLKGYTSFNTNVSQRYQNSGWDKPINVNSRGEFSVCIPLSMLLGFMEDYNKIIMNIRQELILIRSSTDANAIITTKHDEIPKITLNKVIWKIPHISVSDTEKLKLLKYMDSNRDINVAFRSWELEEYPLLPKTQRHSWTIKTSSHLEKPRFIIFAFQTDKKNINNKDASHFDHCHINNIKLHLNSEVFPYDNINVNIENNQWSILYEMYAQFQQSYYYQRHGEPYLSPENYLSKGPLMVLDCCHQMESVKGGAVDIRLEFETLKQIPDKTSAFCLILHDKLIKYNPLNNIVKIL